MKKSIWFALMCRLGKNSSHHRCQAGHTINEDLINPIIHTQVCVHSNIGLVNYSEPQTLIGIIVKITPGADNITL